MHRNPSKSNRWVSTHNNKRLTSKHRGCVSTHPTILEGKELHRFEGHSRSITSVIQLQDGSLVSASHDGSLRFWDLQQGICVKYWRALRNGFSMVLDKTGAHYHSERPIKTIEVAEGQFLPNDPQLAQYAGFQVNNQWVDAWRFPQALRWPEPDAEGNYYSLTLLWAEDQDPQDELGRIIGVE